jgi:hypothetical protein
MDTFASSEGWTAGARLYSGREDPTWQVSEREAESILTRWNRLAPASCPPPEPPPLGYGGCWLRAPDGREWWAGDEVMATEGDARTDTRRKVERALLATAPAGTVPAGL